MNDLVARAPWTWRLLRRPMTRFFERVAPTWDERFGSDPERLAPLHASLDHVLRAPERVLDAGTGTGAAAFIASDRWPAADVTGIDVSPAMIERANAKARRAGVRFEVADLTVIERGAGYDVIVMLNMPPFFAPVSALLRPGGHVAHIASRGANTPFYTSPEKLRAGYERYGLETVASGTAGPGTYYVARLP